VTDIAFASDGPSRRLVRRLPRRLSEPFDVRLALRSVPSGVSASQVTRAASLLAWLEYGTRIAGLSSAHAARVQSLRKRELRVRMAEDLRADDGAAMVPYQIALESLRRCGQLGIRSILVYPIAHHRYMRNLLNEEAALQPEFAATLQMVTSGPGEEEQLDEECALADRILTFSSFHTRTFVEMGIEKAKFIEVPLGVDFSLFRPNGALQRAPDRRFRVLFVGQITQRKGLSYLVEGFQKAHIPDSELLLVGDIRGTDSPWRDVPGVRHLPAQLRTALPAIYAAADVFVMPSLIEGFCLTAMEAMASGLPTIVTPNAFGDAVVRDGVEGWTVPIRDSDAIAECLVRLHDDPEQRREIGARARRRAEDYSWETYERRIVAAVSAELGLTLGGAS
jgi:glycosyltransferase involved in cell wall biosynthesis